MNKKIAAAPLLVLLVAACGSKSNTNPVSNIQQANKDPSLQAKTFVSPCESKPGPAIVTALLTGGAAALKTATVEYQFVGANVTRTTKYYQNGDCTGKESLAFTEAGSFKIGKENKDPKSDGSRDIDFNYKTLSAKVIDDPGIAAANAVKLCGFENWKENLGKDRVVTGNSKDLSCYSEQVPRDENNVYKVEGSSLMFGTQDAANNKRPTSVDTSKKFTAK